MLKIIRSDLLRYEKPTFVSFCKRMLFDTNFCAVFLYRLSHFLYKKKIPLVPKILMNVNKRANSLEISYAATIGSGFRINHSLGIVIGAKTIIGKNFTINQGVTIGGNFGKTKVFERVYITQPVIKNNVCLSAGCKVIGPIIIENNVVVGANSVVLKDVSENSVVVGIPGEILKNVEVDISAY